MRRTGFKRKQLEQRDQRGSPELSAALTSLLGVPADRPRARMASNLAAEPPRVATPAAPVKVPQRNRQPIRDSARGERCTVRIEGCPNDPATTIWSHNRHGRAGKGGALKAFDLNGAYCCTHCDAIYDGQAPLPAGWTREQVELAWYHGHAESLLLLATKGLV